jgi:hypothetical protein
MNHPASMTVTAVCAAVLGAVWLTAWSPSAQSAQAPPSRPRVAVFYEADFPAVDLEAIPEADLRQALAGLDVEWLSASRLASGLSRERHDVLVMPFGSAYPEEAWPAILRFLEAGGSLVNVGGRPFAVAVSRRGSAWQAQPESSACYKALGFTHIFQVPAAAVATWAVASAAPAVPASLATGFRADTVFEADIRLTNTKDFPDEDGSDGPREGRVQPLVVGRDAAGTPMAAPMVRIDRLAGRFTGGAWVLANLHGSVSPAAVRTLVDAASTGAIEITARPTMAGYVAGEVPEIEVTVTRPGASTNEPRLLEATLAFTGPDGQHLGTKGASATGTASSTSIRVGYSGLDRPLGRGLHEVRVTVDVRTPGAATTATRLETRTGFWVYDASMLAGGTPLLHSGSGFMRGGRPFPVAGTTYMASDVHRRFLLEPNPSVWNRDFAQMKAAGVNLVRTGIWTGWKRYMPEVGRLDESALRALDVFLLTARQFDIPVIFNFFAFLPEAWGGENPFLDARAVAAQQAFLGAIARRYPATNDVIWDLINEPSFSAASQLWRTRPNGDASENAAWQLWLRTRYGAGGEDYRAAALRAWGAAPDEGTSLPSLDDFTDRNLFGALRPRKAADYKRFSQDMFTGWVRQMTLALRSNGNPVQLITVGQDEGGLSERPNPLFFGPWVDFTCMHTWWNNDALAWDGILAKLPDRPMLVEETGMMRYERVDGAPWRSEQEAARLLERKLAIAVGSGSSGFVQWIWNTNPFMASDNEAGIGFLRADGTARPELEPFVRLSRFLGTHADRLKGRQLEDVALLVPHSQMFSPRSLAVEATQRAVRVLTTHLHVQVRAVGEYGLADTLGAPRLIIAPSPRVLTDAAWQALMAAVEKGATLLVTGIVDANEHWLPVARTKALGLPASSRPIAGQEPAMIAGTTYRLGYRGDRLERVETAFVAGESPTSVHRVVRGKGTILWMPLPVELAESPDATVALYRAAIAEAGVSPTMVVEPADGSVYVGAITYADAVLVALASESSEDQDVSVSLPGGVVTRLRLPAGRATLLLVDRKSGKVVGKDRD